ncbi:MAG TPA: hypothetical protein VEU33_30645 [Archangium sp.]|nr:hypothetical protein [Archangium sp.]
MPDWTPVFILPNIRLTEAVEFDVAAFAPVQDPRVKKIAQSHASFEQFLGRLTDAFGVPNEPTVLLVRSDAPKAFLHIEALASLRDLFSIAIVGYNRACLIRQYPNAHVIYGESLAFYPWMVDNEYRYLYGKTPASIGIHDVKKFRGQSSPGVPTLRLDQYSIDHPLVQKLLVHWRNRYESEKPERSDIALFRSLNMAYHASLMPEVISASFYDLGRIISLWVSAFEILIHPGEGGRANLGAVVKLIEQAQWLSLGCKRQDHEIKINNKLHKVTLASWLYQKIYRCRCDFLHGEPVSSESLHLPVSGENLFWYAAPLYRVALAASLGITVDDDTSLMSDDVHGYADVLTARLGRHDIQHDFEQALLAAVQPPKSP